MTPAELAEVLACCDALENAEKVGAPGPWDYRDRGNATSSVFGPYHRICSGRYVVAYLDDYRDEAASNFMLACAARNTLRASVGCVRALAEVAGCSPNYDGCENCDEITDAALRAFLDACRAAGVGRVESSH